MNLTPPLHRLLDTPIAELAVSEAFALRAKLMGFSTIREITVSDKQWLHNHPEFSYGWYQELLDLLATERLTGLMD